MTRMCRRPVSHEGNGVDPLAKVWAPPPDETPTAREARLAAERRAKSISDAIDEEINRQRVAEKRAPKCVRVLLLGQSESGKSTTLKNFQLIHSPRAFHAERASWRAVVQLNVVRSIHLILDAMTEAHSTPMASRTPGPVLTPEHLKLKMRLLPLRHVEEALLRRLTSEGSSVTEGTSLDAHAPTAVRNLRIYKELALNSSMQWKIAFSKLVSKQRASFESGMDIDFDDPDDPGIILHACADDMVKLWNDPTVKDLLEFKKIRLEEMAGFFLDSLERVTALRYVPTDDDILRARLKTLGISEHRFMLKAGNMVSHDWRIFDVGGARYLRVAWVPYFDNMDAIIFLAPISCFDQVLVEDTSINRLEDSMLLWKHIVSDVLLANTQTVLFLNKTDILRAKLNAGIQFGNYVLSYQGRPNTFDSVANYLKRKFAAMLKQYSPKPRVFYCHLTTVTDVTSTQHILGNVRDMVIRHNLELCSLV